jgi:hypothetical protein
MKFLFKCIVSVAVITHVEVIARSPSKSSTSQHDGNKAKNVAATNRSIFRTISASNYNYILLGPRAGSQIPPATSTEKLAETEPDISAENNGAWTNDNASADDVGGTGDFKSQRKDIDGNKSSAASVFERMTEKVQNHTRSIKTKLLPKTTRRDEDSSASFWFNWPSFRRELNITDNNEGEMEDIYNSSDASSTSGITKRQLFLDRIALVSERLLRSDNANVADETVGEEESLISEEEITAQSDLTRPGRTIHVVTTAALPWMTGTSVNPVLRAAYLCKMTKRINEQEDKVIVIQPKQCVALVVPWLELEEDRLELYGPQYNFTCPEDQESYIRTWMRDQAGLVEEADSEVGLKIIFYAARYHSGLKSIFAMGDICNVIKDDEEADVCILEEPEHLNWYRAPGDGWTKKFNFVVGIMHTNYKEYAAGHYSGLWTSPAIGIMSSAMVRAYCHKVVKLSDTLQTYAPEKEQVSNVHGVRQGTSPHLSRCRNLLKLSLSWYCSPSLKIFLTKGSAEQRPMNCRMAGKVRIVLSMKSISLERLYGQKGSIGL